MKFSLCRNFPLLAQSWKNRWQRCVRPLVLYWSLLYEAPGLLNQAGVYPQRRPEQLLDAQLPTVLQEGRTHRHHHIAIHHRPLQRLQKVIVRNHGKTPSWAEDSGRIWRIPHEVPHLPIFFEKLRSLAVSGQNSIWFNFATHALEDSVRLVL